MKTSKIYQMFECEECGRKVEVLKNMKPKVTCLHCHQESLCVGETK